MGEIEQRIGARVRWVRELSQLSQAELGERLGEKLGRAWSRQAVSVAEKGGRAFTAAELVAISEVLDTTIADLFRPAIDDIASIAQATLDNARADRLQIARAKSQYAKSVHSAAQWVAEDESHRAALAALAEARRADPHPSAASDVEFIEAVFKHGAPDRQEGE